MTQQQNKEWRELLVPFFARAKTLQGKDYKDDLVQEFNKDWKAMRVSLSTDEKKQLSRELFDYAVKGQIKVPIYKRVSSMQDYLRAKAFIVTLPAAGIDGGKYWKEDAKKIVAILRDGRALSKEVEDEVRTLDQFVNNKGAFDPKAGEKRESQRGIRAALDAAFGEGSGEEEPESTDTEADPTGALEAQIKATEAEISNLETKRKAEGDAEEYEKAIETKKLVKVAESKLGDLKHQLRMLTVDAEAEVKPAAAQSVEPAVQTGAVAAVAPSAPKLKISYVELLQLGGETREFILNIARKADNGDATAISAMEKMLNGPAASSAQAQ